MKGENLHTTRPFAPLPNDGPPPPPPQSEKKARSKANGPAKGTVAPPPKVFWHGEDDEEPLLEWLVEDMLYKEGVGMIAGQWGTYKTFVVIDLSVSVMTKTPFAGRATHRQGGVLFIAAEGQGQVRIRIEGAAIGKVADIEPSEDAVVVDPKRMPFSWVKFSPQLTDPEAAAALRTLFAYTSKEMKARFGLPLALVIIDALMPAAQFKDANDATEARRVMDMLAALGREFELLALPVDHFGKDVSTGTRNSSGKEDAAETILALLGERSLEGVLTNPRMALRKLKGGEQGIVFPFTPREVIVGETDGGRQLKTYVIDWQLSTDDSAIKKAPKTWPKSLLVFKRALDRMSDPKEKGRRLRPEHDAPEVLAVPAKAVRAEFMKTYPTENDDPEKKANAKAKAFERAVKLAVEANLICAREIEALNFETFYWRVDVKQ
jgi:hypothetical protein